MYCVCLIISYTLKVEVGGITQPKHFSLHTQMSQLYPDFWTRLMINGEKDELLLFSSVSLDFIDSFQESHQRIYLLRNSD